MNEATPDLSVIGAGLAGPLMAALLGKRGYRVRLWEMRSDPRAVDQDAGRSINLALSNRGLNALERIGLADEVRAAAIPMRGRMMHDPTGALTFQPYGTEPHHVLYSVSRGELNKTLLTAAEAVAGVDIRFGYKCEEVDPEGPTATFRDPATGELHVEATGRIVGADGAFSKVRAAMQRRPRFDYSQDYLSYGYKELAMPPAPDGGFALEPNALHIWPRTSYMMIALPNADRTFTCTLFWPFEGRVSFAAIGGGDEATGFFRAMFPDVVPLIPDLAQQFERNPVGSLVTVRCRPYHEGDRAVLLGDAAHAVVPFYGQGMNAAFEDCAVLDEVVGEHAPDWATVFARYDTLRKENADALADLALHNFVEMRDHAGTRRFLLQKAWERLLARALPGWYVPLYTLVSFSLVPYAAAVARAEHQDRVVRRGLIGAGLVLLLVFLFLLLR
jgi:kynurenine 3-monooxygenase